MGEDASDFRAALIEIMAPPGAASPPPGDHPCADRWLAYQRGELPAAEEARLQDHLARCRDCFDLAEAAAAFAAPDEDFEAAGEEAGDRAGGDAVAAAALWRQVRPAAEVRDLPSRPVRRERPPPARGARLPIALAASLLVALVGLAGWSLRQQSELERLRAPRPATLLYFAAGERLPGPEAETLAAGEPGMLVFNPSDELPVYRLALRDAATGEQVLARELRPDADLALTLYLPEGLPPGRYRVEIGERAGRVLETHLLRVSGAGGGR